MSPEPPKQRVLLGIYSTKDLSAPSRAKQLWSCQALTENQVEVRPVNRKLVPTGAPRLVTQDDFKRRFRYEPDYVVRSTPVGRSSMDTGAPPKESAPPKPIRPDGILLDRHPLDYDTMSPQARQLSRRMAALHSEGRTLLMQGKVEKAAKVYRNILSLKGTFENDHKYMLSDCGGDMRKAGQLSTAVEFYKHALSVEDKDEHLFFNAARAHFEYGDLDGAVQCLRASLSVNPEFDASARFLRYIQRNFVTDAGT